MTGWRRLAIGTWASVMLVACLLAASADAAPSRVWAHKIGGTGSDVVRTMTPLADGSALVTGYFRNTIVLGSTTLTSVGGDDIFVAKVDANGAYEWAVRFGGTGNDWGFESVVGLDGSIMVVGYFENSVAFGATTLTSAGQTDTFLLRLNADRTVAWAVKGGGTGWDYTYRVALRPNGTPSSWGPTRGPRPSGPSRCRLRTTGSASCSSPRSPRMAPTRGPSASARGRPTTISSV